MSVIFYGVEGLAVVYRVAKSRFDSPQHERTLAESLATLSIANAAAYEERYQSRHGKEFPVTADEIQAAARHAPYDLDSAIGTIAGMHYNCCEEKDHLMEVEGGFKALSSVMNRIMRKAQDALAELEKVKATPAPAPKPSPAPTARPSPASWAKLPGGTWGIRAPGAKSGDVVLASRRDGRSCLMRLTGTVDASKGLFEAEKADSIDQRVASYVSEGLGEF